VTVVADRRTDLGFVIPVAVFAMTLRVPGGFILLGVTGAILILRRGVRFRRTGLLGAYAVCALTSTLAATIDADHNVSSYVWPALCYGLFAAAVLLTGDVADNMRGLSRGLIAALTCALGLAIAEIATGFRLMALGREANQNLQLALNEGRFRTGSVFTNYNDLSVALTILVVLLAGAALFAPRDSTMVKASRLVIIVVASGLVVVMGSRGSLAGLLLGLGTLVLLASRAARPDRLTNGRLGAVVASSLVVVVLIWNSPYVQDNSTAIRERILDNAVHLMDLDPMTWVLGFSSVDRYDGIAASFFAETLMNPHNLVLELLLGYGLPGVLAATLAWFVLVARGVSVTKPRDWQLPAYTAAAVMLPVIGTVPSSTLPYGFPQLLTLGLAAALASAEGLGAAAPGPESVDHDNDADPHDGTSDQSEHPRLDDRAGHP